MSIFSFNLPPPPGFRGFDENVPVTFYTRNLPHWRQKGATYAVTFRFSDALPQAKLQELKRHRKRWEQQHPEPRTECDWNLFAKTVTLKTEHWLDQGYGECHFRNAALASKMVDALQFYEQTKCSVPCFVVMPNHVHAVMKPLEQHQLEDILKVMKGFVANQINQTLGRSGSIWQEESYDRIIRDPEHLYRVVQYLGRNGQQAGLPSDQFSRWICSDWIEAGWNFDDNNS